MKHASLVSVSDNNQLEKTIEVELFNEDRVLLVEKEYIPEELDEFNAEAPKWIVQCKGSQCFLAESDSGEDADGCAGAPSAGRRLYRRD